MRRDGAARATEGGDAASQGDNNVCVFHMRAEVSDLRAQPSVEVGERRLTVLQLRRQLVDERLRPIRLRTRPSRVLGSRTELPAQRGELAAQLLPLLA